AAPIPGISVAGGFKVIIEDRGGLGVQNLQAQTDRLIARLRDPLTPTPLPPGERGNQAAPLPWGERGRGEGVVGVSTQFRSGIPQLYLDINWPKAAALGLSPADVNQTLEIFLGSSYVNSFNEFGRHWQVTLQAAGRFRSHVADIGLLQGRNKWGLMVAMGRL